VREEGQAKHQKETTAFSIERRKEERMLSKDDIEKTAARLEEAERSKVQIRMLSLEYPDMSIEEAYAIQRA
jgi:hypothetical protein